MFARRSLNIAASIVGLSLGLCLAPLGQTDRAGASQTRSVILWVQEVDGQALYWVNDKSWGRAPLSGLVAASRGSEKHVVLTVILDSRVPILEIAEIEGLMAKMDFKTVRYYVFDHVYPSMGMSEIVWKSQSLPLPMAPPKAGETSR